MYSSSDTLNLIYVTPSIFILNVFFDHFAFCGVTNRFLTANNGGTTPFLNNSLLLLIKYMSDIGADPSYILSTSIEYSSYSTFSVHFLIFSKFSSSNTTPAALSCP